MAASGFFGSARPALPWLPTAMYKHNRDSHMNITFSFDKNNSKI
jgi:hypothetical protein